MDENKTLYQLKKLEYLERICSQVGENSVAGKGDLVEQLGQLVSACCLFSACGKDTKLSADTLEGTWEMQDGIAGYVFEADGKGYSYVIGKEDIKIDFTYEIKDDTTVAITPAVLADKPVNFIATIDGDKITLESENLKGKVIEKVK